MTEIPIEVKDNFMASIVPNRTILCKTERVIEYDDNKGQIDYIYAKFYLVIAKTKRTVKAIAIGRKITSASNGITVSADPSKRNKTVINLRLSPKSIVNDFKDIHFQNTRLHLSDLTVWDSQQPLWGNYFWDGKPWKVYKREKFGVKDDKVNVFVVSKHQQEGKSYE